MKYLSGVGLAMSVVFGFLLMALLAELYYMLWWKRRIANARIEDGAAKEFFFMFCGKNPPSSLTMKPREVSRPDNLVRHEPQPRTDSEEEDQEEERSMEAELMRLSGPARFLCTIKEETMEDLESDDSKCRDDSKGRMETPFLTPIASPPYFTPPLTPIKDEISGSESPHTSARQDSSVYHFLSTKSKICNSEDPYTPAPQNLNVNHFLPIKVEIPEGPHTSVRQDLPGSHFLEEGAADSRRPSFKFLREAEEKAQRKEKEEASSSCSEEEIPYRDEENGSFITLVFPRSREGEFVSEFSSVSSSSQVLPLSSSPPSFVSPPSK